MMELNTKFNSQNVSFNSSFVQIGGEKYEGNYEVIPKIEEQKLSTRNKILIDDVIIKSIPVIKVSNTSGGNTVIIGG